MTDDEIESDVDVEIDVEFGIEVTLTEAGRGRRRRPRRLLFFLLLLQRRPIDERRSPFRIRQGGYVGRGRGEMGKGDERRDQRN